MKQMLTNNALTDDLDRAAHALLNRAFPDTSGASEAVGLEQPDLTEQVKAFAAVSAYHISKSKNLPPEKKASPFDAMRAELHGTGAKRRSPADAPAQNGSPSPVTA